MHCKIEKCEWSIRIKCSKKNRIHFTLCLSSLLIIFPLVSHLILGLGDPVILHRNIAVPPALTSTVCGFRIKSGFCWAFSVTYPESDLKLLSDSDSQLAGGKLDSEDVLYFMQGCVKISVQNCQNMSLSQFVYGFIPHKLEHKIINKQINHSNKRKEKGEKR